MCKKRNSIEEILIKLSHISFCEKMLYCFSSATRLMELDHLEILSNMNNTPLPWEIEAFAEMSILSKEKDDTISNQIKTQVAFNDSINLIRNYLHPYLERLKGTTDFANAFMMVTSLLQFKPQENIINRLYRYSYLWSYKDEVIDMQSVFSEKYSGLQYNCFIELAQLVYFFLSNEFAKVNPTTRGTIYTYIIRTHREAVKCLSITRDEYIVRQLEKNKNDLRNLVYGFNYLFPYPFVENNNNLYLPIPYLIIDAVTDSLLTRATNDDNHLREIVGKNVVQSYLEKILKESGVYDEVLPETTYHIRKNQIDTPDVMIKQGNCFCFFDSKLSTPKLSLRQFEEEDQRKTIAQYSKNIIQLYSRIKEFLDKKYYPFSEKKDIKKGNAFGIVVVFENSFVSKREIYRGVFATLGITPESSEAKFIMSNIKLTDLTDIEQFAFSSFNIFNVLLHDRDNEERWNDIRLFGEEYFKNDKPKLICSLNDFQETIQSMLQSNIEDMKKQGILIE